MSRRRGSTVTVTRTIEIEVECEVEIDGKYLPAKTQGPPEKCYPAEYPEASLVYAECNGVDVTKLISGEDEADICEEALEQAAEECGEGPDPDDARDRMLDREWDAADDERRASHGD